VHAKGQPPRSKGHYLVTKSAPIITLLTSLLGYISLLEPADSDSARTMISVDADLKLGKLGTVLAAFAKGKIERGLEHMIEGFGSVVNSG